MQKKEKKTHNYFQSILNKKIIIIFVSITMTKPTANVNEELCFKTAYAQINGFGSHQHLNKHLANSSDAYNQFNAK